VQEVSEPWLQERFADEIWAFDMFQEKRENLILDWVVPFQASQLNYIFASEQTFIFCPLKSFHPNVILLSSKFTCPFCPQGDCSDVFNPTRY